MLNKGSENCYLFILRYGHLDLSTSMYRVSVWRWSSAMGYMHEFFVEGKSFE
jgi:hypothetical protein